MKGENLTVLEQTTQLTHKRSYSSGYPQNLFEKNYKITSEIKFTERKSAFLQNYNGWKKNSAFYSVLQGNHAFASPKEQLYEQMASNPAFTERNIQKANAYLLYSRQEQKSLVPYHTLQSLYVGVWLVNTLTSTAPIGSPTICMWSPADICEQWERNLLYKHQ